MKFRAEPKDVLIFVLFTICLLLLCSLAVVNLATLANEGHMYGFNVFAGFGAKYIGVTFTIFIFAMIFIFASVSSYFFDREKGFGFSTTKKDKGYSRWAKDREIKNKLDKVDIKSGNYEKAGIPLVCDGKNMWLDTGEDHYIIVGSTGSGKTQIGSLPMINLMARAGESIIVTDPKGELYEGTANLLKENGYNIVVLNFREPQKGNSWNPMALPYKLYKEGNTDKAIELLDDLALNILYEEKSSGDPFWEKTGADYFAGLALGLFEDGTEEQVNLNSINLMSNLGEEKFGGPNNNYIKTYFNSKDPSKPAYINASGTVFTAEETKQGILATFKQKIKLFSSRDNLSEMLSYSDFDMKDIGRQKTAVFLIVQDEKKTLHPLATIFLKQCYETLIDVAQECGGHLPHKTNFILDEFANMPPLKDVTTMVTAARSRHIRFFFIIQNYAQLTQVYGKENGETIKGNCNMVYLISSELSALEEISKMCGEVKSKEKDKTASTPLVTVSDLQRLSQFEIIVLIRRMMPYKTKFVPFFKLYWGKKYDKATYPLREKKEVQLFDIREFVKNLQKEKNEKMMESSPFGGGGFNPFSGSSPFSGGSPFGGPSPFGGMPSKPDSDFNVDDLVKRIDAKIAELEAEEEKEKELEKQMNDNKTIVNEINNDIIPKKDIIIDEDIKDDKISIDKLDNTKVEKNDEIDDDKFFDDFFSDE